METSSSKGRFVKAALISFFAVLTFTSSAFAASGSISVEPGSGTFESGEKFEVNIVVSGGGTQLNAAEAKVSLSSNLRADKLTLGDCGFAFVDTPTINNPSFTGVILGGSRTSCTVYTLDLRAVGGGNGFVFISDASIKSFQGAEELLSNVANSSYAISGSGNQNSAYDISPTQRPLANSDGEKMYTVTYTIEANDSEVQDLSVVMDSNQASQMSSRVKPLLHDNSVLAAVFDNVSEGVHTIEVKQQERIVSSEVVNIEGDDREINLGVKPQSGAFSLFDLAIATTLVVIAVAGGVLIYVFYWRKKHPSD